MASVEAYETTQQALYWADVSNLTDLRPALDGLGIPSELALTSRDVLGSTFPAIRVTRKVYRVNVPQLTNGDLSDDVDANRQRTVVAVQTDSETALLMEATVTGVPAQAQANGEIVGNVTFQPRGVIYRCEASLVSNDDETVHTDDVWALIVSGSGTVSRGTEDASGVGLHKLGGSNTTVTVPNGTTAWILEGVAV